MTSDKNHLAICDTQGIVLGEMIFDHDLFLQAALQPAGDDLLGGWLEDWQVQGILYFHPQVDSSNICTVGEYVSLNSPIFPTALRQWLERHNLYSILIPDAYWDLWNDILLLPLLPDEQFRLGMRLSESNGNEYQAFKKSLDKIIKELDKSQKKSKLSSVTKTVKKQTKAKKEPSKPKAKNIKNRIKK
jgi:hypothetical protein